MINNLFRGKRCKDQEWVYEVVTVGRLLSMRYWPTVDQNNFLQKRNAELDEEIETLTSKLEIA